MSFLTGDQELFEWGDDCKLRIIESEKSKEHEVPMTGFDYNSKLGLVASCDQIGTVRVWTDDKKFLRDIEFPHPVDSVCFYNAEGDILVSHEQRVSLIKYKRYGIRAFEILLNNKKEDHKFVLATDELLEDLKIKDEVARGKRAPKAKK